MKHNGFIFCLDETLGHCSETVAARLLELGLFVNASFPPCDGNGVIVYALRTFLRNVKYTEYIHLFLAEELIYKEPIKFPSTRSDGFLFVA